VPVDTLLSPNRGATQVPANTNLEIYFNEPIQKGTGNISVYDGSSTNLIFSIPVTCSCVTIALNKVTIALPSSLSANQVVYVKMVSGVFKNMSEVPFAGFLTNSDWRFTIANGLITNQNFNPANVSSCVSVKQTTFQTTLSGNVIVNTSVNGKIYIYEKNTNLLHDEISTSSAQVVANNTNTITFVTYKTFKPATNYYILITPVSFIGAGGYVYEGIYNEDIWRFKTSEGKAIAQNIELCGGGVAVLTASYTRNDVQYRWYQTPTGGDPIRNESGQIITSNYLSIVVDAPKTYYVCIFYNNCLSYERTAVQVNIKPFPVATLPPTEMRVERGSSVQLEANGGDSYRWYPSTGLSDSSIANPMALIDTTQSYTVTITNASGCSIQKMIRLIIDEGDAGKNLFIPTMFSPNDDGVHDLFRLRGKNIAEVDWSIYDSLGKLLYRTQDVLDALNKGWDGTFNGKPLNSDVYIWTLKGKFSDGSPLPQKAGSVVLIR